MQFFSLAVKKQTSIKETNVALCLLQQHPFCRRKRHVLSSLTQARKFVLKYHVPAAQMLPLCWTRHAFNIAMISKQMIMAHFGIRGGSLNLLKWMMMVKFPE